MYSTHKKKAHQKQKETTNNFVFIRFDPENWKTSRYTNNWFYTVLHLLFCVFISYLLRLLVYIIFCFLFLYYFFFYADETWNHKISNEKFNGFKIVFVYESDISRKGVCFNKLITEKAQLITCIRMTVFCLLLLLFVFFSVFFLSFKASKSDDPHLFSRLIQWSRNRPTQQQQQF